MLHQQQANISASVIPLLSLVDVQAEKIVWQHEVYKEFDLSLDLEHFCSFSSEHVQFGLLFTSGIEGSDFFKVTEKHFGPFSGQKPVEQRRIAASSVPKASLRPPIPPPSTAKAVTCKETAAVDANFSVMSLGETSSPPFVEKSIKKGASSGGKSKKLTREDIGNPTNFRHISHIGFDPERGFDLQNIPPEWKSLFEKAGITSDQLQNKETANFIVNFVEKRGGPPPIPHRRAATASSTSPLRIPPALPSRSQRPAADSTATTDRSPPQNTAAASAPPLCPDRSMLLESIRNSGVAMLKKAPAAAAASSSAAPSADEPAADMASLLAKALSDRQSKLAARNTANAAFDSDDDD